MWPMSLGTRKTCFHEENAKNNLLHQTMKKKGMKSLTKEMPDEESVKKKQEVISGLCCVGEE